VSDRKQVNKLKNNNNDSAQCSVTQLDFRLKSLKSKEDEY